MKVKNQKRIRDEYMTCGICLALAEIASGAEIVEVLENAGITNCVIGDSEQAFMQDILMRI